MAQILQICWDFVAGGQEKRVGGFPWETARCCRLRWLDVTLCYTFPGRACTRGGSVTGAVNWMVWPFRVAATAEGREGHGFLGVRKVFAVASGCYRSRGAVPPRVICTTRRTSCCTPAQRRGYNK